MATYVLEPLDERAPAVTLPPGVPQSSPVHKGEESSEEVTEAPHVVLGRIQRGIHDPRISRNHAKVTILGEEVWVSTEGMNPTFLRLRGETTFVPLKTGQKHLLTEGCSFSLLPGGEVGWVVQRSLTPTEAPVAGKARPAKRTRPLTPIAESKDEAEAEAEAGSKRLCTVGFLEQQTDVDLNASSGPDGAQRTQSLKRYESMTRLRLITDVFPHLSSDVVVRTLELFHGDVDAVLNHLLDTIARGESDEEKARPDTSSHPPSSETPQPPPPSQPPPLTKPIVRTLSQEERATTLMKCADPLVREYVRRMEMDFNRMQEELQNQEKIVDMLAHEKEDADTRRYLNVFPDVSSLDRIVPGLISRGFKWIWTKSTWRARRKLLRAMR
eukprot:TRINITY_DN1341_c0_g1_i3.p1 TRINITY_DN1341_c0_g1~~TRINITY_DN1341_c0_g1_i3.p1  ORF type:complete len:397 (+),score=61.83 TRINITY_DN1341_c0_g1_i3:42-1193(+)